MRIKPMRASGRYRVRVAIHAACSCFVATAMTSPTIQTADRSATGLADITGDLKALLRAGGLAPLQLAGRTLLPIVQGGMGVGVSAHRLAGTVASLGGMGTISSVDLRRLHPDLMERTHELPAGKAATQAAKEAINAANLEALAREIGAARAGRRPRPPGHQRDACRERIRPVGDACA